MLNPLCVAVYPPPPSADPPPTKNKSIPDDAVPKLENVSVPLVKNLILQLSPPSLINSLSPVYVYDTPPVVHDDAWFLIITIPEPPAEPPTYWSRGSMQTDGLRSRLSAPARR